MTNFSYGTVNIEFHSFQRVRFEEKTHRPWLFLVWERPETWKQTTSISSRRRRDAKYNTVRRSRYSAGPCDGRAGNFTDAVAAVLPSIIRKPNAAES